MIKSHSYEVREVTISKTQSADTPVNNGLTGLKTTGGNSAQKESQIHEEVFLISLFLLKLKSPGVLKHL